jgi:hypothetical protein
VIFNINRVEKMRLNSSGNLGIGTTNPGGKLQIVNAAGTTGPQFHVSTGNINLFEVNGTSVVMKVPLYFPDGSQQLTASGASQWAASGSHIYNTNVGNVGVGTTAPSTKLRVFGTAADLRIGDDDTADSTLADLQVTQASRVPTLKLTDSGIASAYMTVSTSGLVFNADTVNKIDFRTNASASDTTPEISGTSRLYINSTGRIGIGTTDPLTTLRVFGSTADVRIGDDDFVDATLADLQIVQSNRVPTFKLTDSGIASVYMTASASGLVFNTDTVNKIDFRTGASGSDTTPETSGTSRLYINSDGNVGIGTTNPGGKLQIVNAAGTTGPQLHVTTSNVNLFEVNGTSVVVGPVNLYVKSAFTEKLNNTAWSNPSDIRLKDITGNYVTGLKELGQLQPIRYRFKPNNALGASPGGEHIGFIAQEVQKVLPEAITTGDDGYLRLTADPIFWTMLNSIKELKAEKDAEILKLRGDIVELRNENQSLREERDIVMHLKNKIDFIEDRMKE